MKSMTKKYKQNEVKLIAEKSSNMLQLWLPKKYAERHYGKRQKAISFGAKATEENWLLGEQARIQLQLDLDQDNFDPSNVIQYKHPSKQQTFQSHITQLKNWTIYELWRKFAESKRGVVAETTYLHSYQEGSYIDNYFKALSQQTFSRSQEQEQIKNELSKIVGGRRVLVDCYKHLTAMIRWGIETELLSKDQRNRFPQFRKEQEQFNKRNNLGKAKPPTKFTKVGEQNREKIAFTWQEAEAIISAYHNRKNHKYEGIDYLAYLVEFLFLTGVRHGEARALSWGDISLDGKNIKIAQSYSKIANTYNYTMKSTKNGKERTLPLNHRTQTLLKTIKPECVSSSDPIFMATNGNRVKGELLWRTWLGYGEVHSIILSLIEQGKVTQYLPPYATRKTFITHQLQNGIDPKTLAYWVGDEVETIMKYYSDVNREAIPIERGS